jgi:hypothetical protein
VAVVNARERIFEALLEHPTHISYVGTPTCMKCGEIDNAYEHFADAVLAVLPELLTDEQTVDATARVLYGGYEASEATKSEVRVTLAATAKVLTKEPS